MSARVLCFQTHAQRMLLRRFTAVALPAQIVRAPTATAALRSPPTRLAMAAVASSPSSAAAASSFSAAATPVVHNTKKGFNAAAKNTAKNPALMHLLFIRHAESKNNVIAEMITKELGANPYGPNNNGHALAEYDRRRSMDPELSPLGQKQAGLLPHHPHLLDIHFEHLAAAGRVRVITSPMQRAILTSRPLLASVHPPLRATMVADVCEKGGSYTRKDGQNVADPGKGRSALAALWGSTHDVPAAIPEHGWWQTHCKGEEDSEAFEQRLLRAKEWIHGLVEAYKADPATTPDYTLIVSHADFIDAILTKLLGLPAGHAKYVFYSSNTSISHVEFDVSEVKPAVRIRGCNIKPVAIQAHELAEIARTHHEIQAEQK